MFDISAIKPTDRTIELLHPANGAKLGIRVSVVSMNDEKVKKIRRKIQDEKLRLEARGKNFKAEDIEDNTNELIFNAMTGWEWYNPTEDTKTQPAWRGNTSPEFNRATVMQILNDPGMSWFADQISEAISEEKAFFNPSKTI